MPWNSPFKDGSKVEKQGGEVSATEAPSGGETCGEKIGKGGRTVGGGKVVKVSKVAKERVKGGRSKPSIDGLAFSLSPVKMKRVSLIFELLSVTKKITLKRRRGEGSTKSR